MKTKNIAGALAALIVTVMLVSCSDNFLNTPPKDSIVDVNFFKNDAQVLAGSADLYTAVWKDYCDQANWKIGDVKAGLVFSPWATSSDIRDFTTFNITGLSAANVNAYKSFYQVVGFANTLIRNINTYAGADVTDEVKRHALGEAHFMRATAYTYLVMNYNEIPIIEDNTSNFSNPNAVFKNTRASIWEFIRRDFRYASKNLMAQAPQEGRLTRWSAEGMLARTFLNMAGISGSLDQTYLDSAKYFADRVITLSGKSLVSSYANLFKYPYDNNSESLFELQWVYTPNSSLSYKYANTMVSQITPDNSIAANGDGWGGGVSATSWMLQQYDTLYSHHGTAFSFTLDQRLQASFMLPGFAYPELPATTTTFLNANHEVIYNPSNVTAGNATDGQGYSFAYIKKYVIGGVPESNKQDYPNDTYMLRLAEMYLIYAEASVLKGDGDPKALQYFNAVHTRAGLPEIVDVTDLNWYMIFKERVTEFAMEGIVWYDLVRRFYYHPDGAFVYNADGSIANPNDIGPIDILNSQRRSLFLVVPDHSPNTTGWSFYDTSWVNESVTATHDNFFMGIPQVEISQAPNLAPSIEAVDYQFTN